MTKDIKEGIGAYSEAFKLVSELKLWKFFFIPALIGLLIGGGIIVWAYAASDNIGEYLNSWYPFEFGKSTLEWIADVVGRLLVIVIGFLLYRHALMALSAPFMAPISEKIEAHLSPNKEVTKPSSGFAALLIRGIRVSFRNVVFELLITLPLLLFSFIPVLNIVSTILIFYTQSFYAGFGNMDYTLERHRKYKETGKFIRKNRGLAVGNGFIFMLMLLIPFIGIMLTLPLSTAAASIVTTRRLNSKKFAQA